jgi:hypothetical protein
LTIEFSQSLEAINAFHSLLCLTRQRHGTPPQPFAFFANIQRHVLAENQGCVVLARHGQVTVAGAVFFHFGRTVIYKYGASNQELQHLRANNLVMWEAIRKYARDGFTHLDFGRTSLHNEGLRRFKLGWGTQERRIDYFRYDIKKSCFVTVREENAETLHRLYRFIPICLSRLIGALLYKHIAALLFSFTFGQPSNYA